MAAMATQIPSKSKQFDSIKHIAGLVVNSPTPADFFRVFSDKFWQFYHMQMFRNCVTIHSVEGVLGAFAEENIMYQSGDWVVYGIHGVCRVIGFEKQLVNRKRTQFLVLEPAYGGESRFYLPAENAAVLAKLKPVLTDTELVALLGSEEIRKPCWIAEENLRKQFYRELIASGDRVRLMQMVTSLYRYRAEQQEAGRKFHLCDDNFLRDAEKLLASEIALVMKMEPPAAREFLREKLGK